MEFFIGLAKQYNTDLVRGRSVKVNDKFDIKDSDGYKTKNIETKFYDKNPELPFMQKLKGGVFGCVWLCLFKASVLKNIRFLPQQKNGGEDVMYMLQVVDKIKSCVFTNMITYIRRESSISTVRLGKYKLNKINYGNSLYSIPFTYKFAKTAKRKKWAEFVYKNITRMAYRQLVRNTIKREFDRVWARETLQKIIVGGGWRPDILNPYQRIRMWMFLKSDKK